jgi:hypothetical protein
VFSNFSAVEFVLPAVEVVAVDVLVVERPKISEPALLLPINEDLGAGVLPSAGVDVGVLPNSGAGGDMRDVVFEAEELSRTSPVGKGLVCAWAIAKLKMNAQAVPIDMKCLLSVMGVVLLQKWIAMICYFASPRI